MIFYSDVARDLATDTYVNLTAMVVYRGSQPSIQNYITGVNSGTYKWNGNYLLQAYKDVELSVNAVNKLYKVEKSTSTTDKEYGDYIKQAGNAQWAVLFDTSMLEGENQLLEFTNTNQLNFLRNITEEDLFMIVPVSTTLGYGVIRFDTIEFNGLDNQVIKKFSLNFS